MFKLFAFCSTAEVLYFVSSNIHFSVALEKKVNSFAIKGPGPEVALRSS